MPNSATSPKERCPFADMPVPQQAGIPCNDERFQNFAALRSGFPANTFNPSAAAEYLRQQCGIDSRRELATDPTAQAKFQTLRTEFDAWTGKIATPR